MAYVAPQWRVPAYAALVWRRWQDEYVFHHALSNDTHRLAEIPGELLVRLATSGGQTTEELAQHFVIEASDIDSVLQELAGLDLVACR